MLLHELPKGKLLISGAVYIYKMKNYRSIMTCQIPDYQCKSYKKLGMNPTCYHNYTGKKYKHTNITIYSFNFRVLIDTIYTHQ